MNEDNSEDLELYFVFVTKWAIQCYGPRYIKKKLRTNKGTIILDVVTASDMAYVEAVMVDQKEYWIHLLKLSKLCKAEKDKYLKKNQHKMSDEDKAKYSVPEKMFTNKDKKRRHFGEDSWTTEGKQNMITL